MDTNKVFQPKCIHFTRGVPQNKENTSGEVKTFLKHLLHDL